MEIDDTKRLEFLLNDGIAIKWDGRNNNNGQPWTMVVAGSQSIRQFSGMTKKECIDEALGILGWWTVRVTPERLKEKYA